MVRFVLGVTDFAVTDTYKLFGGDALINVKSEIAPLKKVLLHRPGKELEHLVPNSLSELLFDDIPYLQEAQKEHDHFARALKDEGVEVVYLEDLMAEVLEKRPELLSPFIHDVIKDSNNGLAKLYERELEEYLLSFSSPLELVLAIMSGITEHELKLEDHSSLASLMGYRHRFVLDPIPNLYFTRDSFASIGNGVSINRMFTNTRRRETLFAEYIFRYHEEYRDVEKFYDRDNLFPIEGGDIFNLSERALMIGLSERTSVEGIELISNSLFTRSPIENILVVQIPSRRAFMHLDTVLTQVDYDKFVIHPFIRDHVKLYSVDKKGSHLVDKPLDKALAEALGQPAVELINCGGDDMIASEREQWNDGSNTLCIKPGTVLVYNRNVVTNKILESNGIKTIELPSSELSRGRGGPRCMSMPLVRGE